MYRVLIPSVAAGQWAADPRGEPASVRVEQAPGEVTWLLAANVLLPRRQPDCPFVFLTGAMLRVQARPVPRIGNYLGAPYALLHGNLVAGPYGAHRRDAFGAQSRPRVRAADAERPDPFRRVTADANTTIAELEAE